MGLARPHDAGRGARGDLRRVALPRRRARDDRRRGDQASAGESRREVVGTSGVDIVRADDRHAPALAEFYRAVWDPSATPEAVRRARATAAAQNPVTPGEEVPTFLFLQRGRVLGHVTTIPVRLHAAGTSRPGHWVKGLMVVPEHRNGPVGMLLLKEAVRQLDLAMAMVVQPAPRRLFQAL